MPLSLPDMDEKYISAQSFKMQFNRIEDAGINVEEIATHSGISLTDIEQGKPGSLRQKIDLLKVLQTYATAADFYLRPNDTFNIARFSLIGFAMLSSQDMGKALQLGIKYYPITGSLVGIGLNIDHRNNSVYIELKNQFELEVNLLRNVLEDVLATLPPLLECLCGNPIDMQSIELAYPPPEHSPLYEEILGIKPRFNAEQSRLGFCREVMDLPVTSSNPDAAILLEQSCQKMLAEFTPQSHLLNSVREHLLGSMGNLIDRAQLAQALHMSERTLRRRLASENTSYSKLVSEIKQQAAKDYLRNTNLSIEQIGDVVGYTEPTNFRRAFLRWTGKTPTEYRTDIKQ